MRSPSRANDGKQKQLHNSIWFVRQEQHQHQIHSRQTTKVIYIRYLDLLVRWYLWDAYRRYGNITHCLHFIRGNFCTYLENQLQPHNLLRLSASYGEMMVATQEKGRRRRQRE